MKTNFLYRLLLIIGVLFYALQLVFPEAPVGTLEITSAAIGFGSLIITESTGTPGAVVFDAVLEDWVGGANLNRARLLVGTSPLLNVVLAGALLYINNGAAEVIKTATAITGGTATAIRVNKAHFFKAADVVLVATGSVAYTIQSINYSNADYDVITINTTLGVTPGDGDLLVQAAVETAGADSATLYTANAILKNDTDIQRANPSASGVVRGSVRSVALPYGAFSEDIEALSLIRFV